MSQIINKFLSDSAVDASKIAANAVSDAKVRLANEAYLRGRNAADSADVEIVKVNAANALEFASVPQVTADAATGNALVRKSQLETMISTKADLVDGRVPLSQISLGAIERITVVADQAARFALTTATVQDGDTVKQADTNVMYWVKDQTNLGNAAGYEIYAAGTAAAVAWSGVSGTPTTISGYGITDATPSSRTVNGHALTADVTVTKSDVGLGNVDNVQQLPMSYLSTNTALGTSDVLVPSQNAVKAYVDGKAQKACGQEALTLIAGDITAQYKDLAQTIYANSLMVFVSGIFQRPTLDYTLSTESGKTRITFAGDLATGGNAALVAGDVIYAQYMY